MKVIEKKVYYCGFCKKHGLSRVHMEEHEKHCTLNIERQCRMPWCDMVGMDKKIDDLVKYIDEHFEKASWGEHWGVEIPKEYVAELLEKSSCPIDTLAVLRIAASKRRDKQHGVYWEFDFKKEAKEQLEEYAAESRPW